MEKITKQQLISKLENATNKININNNVTIKGDTLYTIIEVLKNDYSKKDMVSEDYLQNMFELLEAIIDYDRANANQPCFPIKDKFRIITDKDYDKLSPLLDNKAYKFEELKEGIWVWDKVDKLYAQIYELIPRESDADIVVLKYRRNPYEYINYDTEYIRFEPDRFYPREVK